LSESGVELSSIHLTPMFGGLGKCEGWALGKRDPAYRTDMTSIVDTIHFFVDNDFTGVLDMVSMVCHNFNKFHILLKIN